MVDRSAEHWYPTAAYLYVLHLDGLALAWEYLRRHPDYRLDWLRRHRRPQAAQEAAPVSYTHLRAHETGRNLVCRLLLEKKKNKKNKKKKNIKDRSNTV